MVVPGVWASVGDVIVSVVAIVTAPVLARARPWRFPPPSVMLVTARMLPTMFDWMPFQTEVNEEPTIQ